jgi:hypothetical protein
MSASSITWTDVDLLPNPHPGEIPALELMHPLGLSQNALARALHAPPRRFNELVRDRRAGRPIAICASPANSASPEPSSSLCRPTTTGCGASARSRPSS